MHLIKTIKHKHNHTVEFNIPEELYHLFEDKFYILAWSYYWHRYEELY